MLSISQSTTWYNVFFFFSQLKSNVLSVPLQCFAALASKLDKNFFPCVCRVFPLFIEVMHAVKWIWLFFSGPFKFRQDIFSCLVLHFFFRHLHRIRPARF